MNHRITIKVVDFIGSHLCISAEDGQKVFDKILPLLQADKNITISFEHIDTIISLFLNVAIGQLYGSLSEEKIKALVKVEGLSMDDMELLKQVVDNAKKYYANPKSYDSAWESEEDDV